jgi:hypothetical protein
MKAHVELIAFIVGATFSSDSLITCFRVSLQVIVGQFVQVVDGFLPRRDQHTLQLQQVLFINIQHEVTLVVTLRPSNEFHNPCPNVWIPNEQYFLPSFFIISLLYLFLTNFSLFPLPLQCLHKLPHLVKV